MEVYLVRHGECVMNQDRSVIGGRAMESPLTAQGIIEAKTLGKVFYEKGIRPTKFYTSTAVRAKQTAETTIAYMGLIGSINDLIESDQILELDQGDWMGQKRAETYTPEILERIKNDPLTFCPPNGESQKDVEHRVTKYIVSQVEKAKEEDIFMFFTHGYAIRLFLRGIMNWNPQMNYRIFTDNCGVTKLTYNKGEWSLKYFNRVATGEF